MIKSRPPLNTRFHGLAGFSLVFGIKRQVVTSGWSILSAGAEQHLAKPREADAVGGGRDAHLSLYIKDDFTMRHRLKLYTGEDASAAVAEPDISLSLGEISEILADAVRTRRAWLNDFADDRIQVSADLYEVLSAYWNMRRGA
ncbi:MAG TPA: hypothetical protein VL475_03385 [Planctomycetaceae bacterium]|nr:hypothetical protein [Planctomycetaceae bacterium]